MSYLSAQAEIMAELNAIPNVSVYQGITDDGKLNALIADSDQIKPFIAVGFGTPMEPHTRINGIAGARLDSFLVNFMVHCVGSTDKTSQTVWNLVWEKLIGFTPENCSEIRPALFGGVGQTSVLGNPTRYSATQAWTLVINSDLT